MSKVHEDNAGYVGVSYEETQDPYFSYNKLSLPLNESDKTVVRNEETFTVTVAGGKFVVNGVSQASLSLAEGDVYTFDQSDSSNSNHPLRFSYTEDGTHGGGQEYTLGVTTNGTPGSAGAYTKIVVPFALHDLYYYCSNHSGMGGSANVVKNTKAFTVGRPILKTTDAFGAVSATPSILFGYDNSDNSFDTSGTSVTVDATGYTYNSWSGSQLASALGGVGANSAQVVKASDGSIVTWHISTDTTDRYIFTSSDGQNWSSPGGYYDTDGSYVTVTSKWLAWSAGANVSTTTVSALAESAEDPYAANLVLAVPMAGGNFNDIHADIKGSGTNKNVDISGVTSSTNSRLYGSAGEFVGATDHLQFYGTARDNTPDFAFAANEDFTVEAWIWWDSDNQTGNTGSIVADYYEGTANNSPNWQFVRRAGGVLGIWWNNNGTTVSIGTGSGFMSNKTWHHVVVQREASTFKFFVDGHLRGSHSSSSYSNAIGRGRSLWVGIDANEVAEDFCGYIQDLRVYKGIAKYTTPFPTASYGMEVLTYSGNGTTKTISGLNFQPDLIWLKEFTDTGGVAHYWGDTVRGVNYALQSNTGDAQNANHVYGYISAVTSDGFTVTAGSNDNFYTNGNQEEYAAWTWRAGGETTADNTEGLGQAPTSGSVMIDGSVSTTALPGTEPFKRISASNQYGFSIVKFEASDNGEYPTGLQTAPDFLIYKSIDSGQWWRVYFSERSSSSKTLYLNQDYDEGVASDRVTSTSSTTFTIGDVNQGEDYIAYCWSQRDGFSKFSTYSGQSNVAHHVECGFRPAWLMVKCTTTGNTNWHIFDDQRGAYRLIANLSSDRGSPASYAPTFTDTGFTVAAVSDTHTNATGHTYFFAAFAASAVGEGFESAIVDQLATDDLSGNDNNASNNGATFQTSVKKFYDGAADFSSNSKVTVSGSDFAFGTGDYTIEMWVYHTALGAQATYFGDTFGSTAGVYFYKNTANYIGVYYSSQIVTGGTLIPQDSWVHVAAVRNAGTTTVYVNGSPDGSGADSTNLTVTDYGVGETPGGNSGSMEGYIQDVRVYKGIAKYTSSFSPPERSVQGTARRYPSGIYVVS